MSGALFFRLLAKKNKSEALSDEVRRYRDGEESPRQFEVWPRSFTRVPTTPFAYWVSDRIRKLFEKLPRFEGEGRTVKQGLATADDFRFVRAWWEVPATLALDGRNGPDWRKDVEAFQEWCQQRTKVKSWVPFAKGGDFSPYYADLHLVLCWARCGEELKAFVVTLPGTSHWSRRLASYGFYYRSGITWPRRTTSGMSSRLLPAACIFADKAPSAFCETSEFLVTLLQSAAFQNLVAIQLAAVDAAARSYEVGVIQRTPVPDIMDEKAGIVRLTNRCIDIKREVDRSNETSHLFTNVSLLVSTAKTIAERAVFCSNRVHQQEIELRNLQREIDDASYKLYGISDEDRSRLEAVSGNRETQAEERLPVAITPYDLVTDLLSWAVGVAFGRWDIRLATGERPIPELGDPFDPLPVCSPGMLQGDDGLPLREAPAGYPIRIDEDGILVDEPGHDDDIVGRVREVLQIIFGDRAGAIEQEACEILGVRKLRDYFSRTSGKCFWVDHVKKYSKSRRRAPIYWLLQRPGGVTRFWLYLHRLDQDTISKLRGNNYLGGMIERARQELGELRPGLEPRNLSKLEEQRLDALDQKLVDMDEIAERLRRISEQTDDRGKIAGYLPDLDDGVVLCAAPLHQLIPWPYRKKYHGKQQSELAIYWQQLAAGDYDWAKIAMHYWPSRVEQACRSNLSFAIAHDRRDLYDGDGDGGNAGDVKGESE